MILYCTGLPPHNTTPPPPALPGAQHCTPRCAPSHPTPVASRRPHPHARFNLPSRLPFSSLLTAVTAAAVPFIAQALPTTTYRRLSRPFSLPRQRRDSPCRATATACLWNAHLKTSVHAANRGTFVMLCVVTLPVLLNSFRPIIPAHVRFMAA